jgi:hypothetical protein
MAVLRHQPKVGQFGIEVLVQHYIGRLDIPMQDDILAVHMEVS